MMDNKSLFNLVSEGKSAYDIMTIAGFNPSDLTSVLSFVDVLISLISSLKLSMDQNTEQTKLLTAEVKNLVDMMQAKNKTNSKNSSLPPSREGLSKPNRNRSLRESSGRKAGAQNGHKGNGLVKFECNEVNKIHHYPKECMKCENFSSCLELMTKVKSGHVYEVKSIVVDNEHIAYSVSCPKMQKLFVAEMDNEVKSSQQYGNSIKSVIVDLWATGVVSINRLGDLLEERIGKRIATGTIVKTIYEFAQKCGSTISRIKNFLTKEKVKGADETGMRTDGSLYWLHTLCSDKATYLYADKKRGFEAIQNDGTLLKSTGFLVHDCWAPYFSIDNIRHAVCLQHIQRELRGAANREKDHASYFTELENFLLKLKKERDDAVENNQVSISKKRIIELKKEFILMLNSGLKIFERPKKKRLTKVGRKAEGKTRSLLLRLKNNVDFVFCFLEDVDVWYTNNTSERTFRIGKVRQAVSKCFRTKKGLDIFATVTSIFDTARKNKIKRMEMINAVFKGTADELLSSVLC